MLFKTNQIMFYVIIPRSLKIYYCMVNAMNNFNTNDNDLSIENYNPNDLVDIRNIVIDKKQPIENRILSFVEQIKNPYLFKVGNIAVKVNFNNNNATLQERLENYLKDCLKN